MTSVSDKDIHELIKSHKLHTFQYELIHQRPCGNFFIPIDLDFHTPQLIKRVELVCLIIQLWYVIVRTTWAKLYIYMFRKKLIKTISTKNNRSIAARFKIISHQMNGCSSLLK